MSSHCVLQLGIYTTVEPLIIIVMVLIFLGEKPTLFVLIGAALIVLGVAMVIYEQSKDETTSDAPSRRKEKFIALNTMSVQSGSLDEDGEES